MFTDFSSDRRSTITTKMTVSVKKIEIAALMLFLQFYFFIAFAKYKMNDVPTERPFLGVYVLLSLIVIAVYFSVILRSLPKFSGAIAVTITLIILLMPWTIYNERSFKDFLYFTIHLLGTTVLFTLIKRRFHENNYGERLILKSIVAFAIASGIFACYVFLKSGTEFNIFGLKIQQNIWTATRIHGFLGEPTSLGCVIALALTIQLSHQEKPSLRGIAISLLLLVLLILTGSRNGIVSLLFALSVCYVIQIFRRPFISRRYLLFFVVLLLIAICVFYNMYQKYEAELSYYFLRGMNNEESRLYVWSRVIDLMQDKSLITLVFGSGFGSLSNIYQSAFNNYLQFFYDFGIIGSLVIIIFYLWLYSNINNDLLGIRIFFLFLAFLIFISWFPTDGYNGLILCMAYLINQSRPSPIGNVKNEN